MFLDEDEDLAHEFYEEYRIQGNVESVVRWSMRRIKDNLRPQVIVCIVNDSFCLTKDNLQYHHFTLTSIFFLYHFSRRVKSHSRLHDYMLTFQFY